ncbi:hypothetical protein FFLO_07116 [Filobasidium floriforme]|uniref:Extradiol ring-cleavage dioxygenase class III enzyme subunit B domain-containing protein n=1 Tax=Filobasidium floriforme TaxID=5210 RepID=A0A8K0NPU6_9TREE|nr:Extradiol ring-cleavage dioxygenase, class III enzyme, subunit B [Filobasidium floriforme]KAG7527257.1 hypothetical protein FFLO_07116 [Filobasidium floriforme]KAH8088553.1 Extradiol ring-cleavage dioxygenase, class III enzyme, subunit B [Filobasidium floriforme]
MTITMPRAPVYFISHGGPPSMYAEKSGPYQAWGRVGQLIRRDIGQGKVDKKKGFVCVSAHWESDDTKGKIIEVNNNPGNPLIYDFYNFPTHYYSQTFHSSGPDGGVEVVKRALEAGGWEVKPVDRGLDHGLWVPFKIAFSQPPVPHAKPPTPSKETLDLIPPLIQISLPGDSSPKSAEKLGEVLGKLRGDGWGVVCTGQAVHNLRELGQARSFGGRGTTYGQPFLTAFLQAATSPLGDIGRASKSLFKREDYRRAHPTPEHLMPLVVAAGAVQSGAGDSRGNVDGEEGEGKGEVIFEEEDGPLGWAMVRWD